MNKPLDVSTYFNPGDFPCCPLCDNEIFEQEEACFVVAHGSKAAAHTVCRDKLHMSQNHCPCGNRCESA